MSPQVDRQQLLELLDCFEWRDLEFKEARNRAPASALETVSAFANTDGGVLVFGVAETAAGFRAVGVDGVDKVQNEFLSAIRSEDRISLGIDVTEKQIRLEHAIVLVFEIGEAAREYKPIHLKGDIRKSFLRRGGCDVRCTAPEIHAFLRDAAAEPYEDGAVDISLNEAFAHDDLVWFMARLRAIEPALDLPDDDVGLLKRYGLLKAVGGQLKPRRAGILLFGSDEALAYLLPRPVVAVSWVSQALGNASNRDAWLERSVIESNIVTAWRTASRRYAEHAGAADSLEDGSLSTEGRPPDYIAFREAVVNLLVHQDYGDHTRTPAIEFATDGTRFWNPGAAFVNSEELMQPGEKNRHRNPRLVSMLRRIGLSEGAGSGLPAITKTWNNLGRVPPRISSDRSRNSFEVVLPHAELMTEEQRAFQAKFGVRLVDADARLFALCCRAPVSLVDAQRLLAADRDSALTALRRLENQQLVARSDETGMWSLSSHLASLADESASRDGPCG